MVLSSSSAFTELDCGGSCLDGVANANQQSNWVKQRNRRYYHYTPREV